MPKIWYHDSGDTMNTTVTFFEQQMNNCIEEFTNLYQSYKYISHKEINIFLNKYSDLFSLIPKYKELQNNKNYQKLQTLSQNIYEMIEQHNRLFIKKGLEVEKEYFDTCFKKK